MGDEKCGRISVPIEQVLHELEPLLRQTLGSSLIVDSYTTSSLSLPWQNYGSTLLTVEAKVKRNGPNSEPETMFFVAKMLSPTMYEKLVFREISTIFQKEIYMYKRIAPAFRVLEIECGIPETEIFQFPKFYGARMSLEESEDKLDSDAVILMENLKLKNFFGADRTIGLDFAHARAAVEAMAHFHALAIAMKMNKPQLFEEFKVRAKSTQFGEKFCTEVAHFIANNVKKVPDLLPYLSRIEKVLFRSTNDAFRKVSVEPWGAFVHADMSLLNIMFRDDVNGNPEDVRIIDFQDYRYRNPLRDLVFFLFSSCQKEVRITGIWDLVDSYYKTIISHLSRLRCNVNLFSRDSFNEQLTYAANLEYIHCTFITRLLLSNAPVGGVFEAETSDEYRERLAEITLRFIKENWI